MTKLAACVDGDVLLGAVEASPLLGYVAGYLASGVPGVAGLSLVLADMLLDKLPSLARVRTSPPATQPAPPRPAVAALVPLRRAR